MLLRWRSFTSFVSVTYIFALLIFNSYNCFALSISCPFFNIFLLIFTFFFFLPNEFGPEPGQLPKVAGPWNRLCLWACTVAPTKIIVGLGLSLGVDILDAPEAIGAYPTLLTWKASVTAKALSAPSQSCPRVFAPGEDELKAGRSDGYDFGFLHIKVIILWLLVSLSALLFAS